jgi:hypothetical protein
MLGVGSELVDLLDYGNSKHVVAGTLDGSLALWNVHRRMPVHLLRVDSGVIFKSFSEVVALKALADTARECDGILCFALSGGMVGLVRVNVINETISLM